MFVYIGFISLFISSAVLEVSGLKKEQACKLLQALTVILTLFIGLRFHTGADWSAYIRIFNNSLSSNNVLLNNTHVEFGYLLLNKLFKYIFDDYYVLQFAATGFVSFAFYRFVRSYSPYPIVSFTLIVCCLFFNIFMAQIRQSIAVAIVALSIQYIFDRKILQFTSMIAIAFTFHTSAIFAMPLFFLYRNYGKIIPLTLILLAHLSFIYSEWMTFLGELIVPYLPDRLSVITLMYLNHDLYGAGIKYSTGFIHSIYICIGVLLLLFEDIKDKRKAFFINAMTIFLVIKGLSLGINIIQSIELYYLVYCAVAYIYLIKFFYSQVELRAIVASCLLLLFSFIIIYRVSSNDFLHWIIGRKAIVIYHIIMCLFIPMKQANDVIGWNKFIENYLL